MTSHAPVASLSVVIPVYRSAEILPKLVERLEPVLAAECDAYELILVDDGSPPDTWEVVQKLADAHPWVRGICLMRNYGQHNAVLCGIREARYETIVTMDDDLQHPPEEIPRLLREFEKGYDVVYGTPHHGQHGVLRGAAAWVTKLALRSALGADTARMVSAFRVIRTEMRGAFEGYRSPFVSIDVLLTWGSTRFSAVRVEHASRQSGDSGYSIRKLTIHALNMMTGFSTFPLQIASLVGFAFTLVGALVVVFVVGRYLLQGTPVPGFPFLASIIAIFSGAQLFSLGIIGEYLARMHFRTMERPTYGVRVRTTETPSSS